MKNIYKLLLKNSEYSYDTKKVSRLIIKIKRTSDERIKQECKEELFISLSKIIVKAINNFFNLIKDISPEKILHTKEDLCSECFMVTDNCIEKLQLSQMKLFYFYLNTSLNRRVFRLYEKNYKKHFSVINNSDESESLIVNKSYNHHFDNMTIDLQGFTEQEIEFVKFKLSGQKLNIFLKKQKMLPSVYYEINNSVIEKLKILYSNDEDLKRFFNQ